MTTLRWGPTPYRSRGFDEIADVGDGLGRYRIRKERGKFKIVHNGVLVGIEPTVDDARRRAELGAHCLRAKKAGVSPV